MIAQVRGVAREVVRGVRRGRRFVRGVRILAYHGVVERRTDPRVEESFHTLEDFRAHLEVLRRARVVSLDGLEDALRDRVRPAIAVTFDDGFENNILAAELLAAARIPATFFVSSDCIEHGTTIWPTLLRLILARGSARRLRFGERVYDLDGDPESFRAVRAMFKDLSTEDRLASWETLLAQLRPDELSELVEQFPSLRMMTWRDVGALRAAGFAIGSHGYRHELQHADQTAELRRHELVDSRKQIEDATGYACTAFAFPNGTVNHASADESRSAGYTCAFTMVSRAARADDQRMLLPRILPGGSAEKLAAHLLFGN